MRRLRLWWCRLRIQWHQAVIAERNAALRKERAKLARLYVRLEDEPNVYRVDSPELTRERWYRKSIRLP